MRTDEPTLGVGIGRLNGTYAQRFNRRHATSGHVWGKRYHAVLVESHAHFLEVVRYIALNPVKAGLCARAEDWQWGAHRALAGLESAGIVAADTTYAYLGADGGDGRRRYRDLVAQPKEGLAPFKLPADAES